MAIAQTLFVSLDCADPEPLARFWAAMLDGEVAARGETVVAVRTPWVWLTAIATPGYEPPTWPDPAVPKQVHLDLAVADLDAAAAEAERLGASPADVQPAPDRWRVMFDPAGHPFCLTTQVPPELR